MTAHAFLGSVLGDFKKDDENPNLNVMYRASLPPREEKQKGDKAYKPADRKREVPPSLRAYAANVSSADLGAIRLI